MKINKGLQTLTAVREAIVYGGTFLLSLFGPLVATDVATGLVSPRTIFITAMVICPASFLLLGFFYGRRTFITHFLLLLSTALDGIFSFGKVTTISLSMVESVIEKAFPKLALVYFLGLALRILYEHIVFEEVVKVPSALLKKPKPAAPPAPTSTPAATNPPPAPSSPPKPESP